MPFDGSMFTADKPVASEARPKVYSPGLWQRIGTALAVLVAPTRAREFRLPLSPMRTPPDPVEMLGVARDLIADERSWVQRRYETRDGRRCAVGALRNAARLMHGTAPHGEAVSNLLAVATSRGFNDIETMNDHSTHAQVISAFDEAIIRIRQSRA
jgi:hypothetical protein